MGAPSSMHFSISLLRHPPPFNVCNSSTILCNAFYFPKTADPIPLLHYSCSCKPIIRAQRSFIRSHTVVARSKRNKSVDSRFLDEDGAVKDMDAYLNYLSLEYESVWDTKPAWCQPWTILLTGAATVTGSWIVVHSVVFTMFVLFVICTWWYIFLYSYPKEYKEMIAERRKKVSSGMEDTFGVGKSQ
ncbi:hypothetical protein AMTRI_Chr03g140250 [Amborella trichopoda]